MLYVIYKIFFLTNSICLSKDFILKNLCQRRNCKTKLVEFFSGYLYPDGREREKLDRTYFTIARFLTLIFLSGIEKHFLQFKLFTIISDRYVQQTDVSTHIMYQ